jgi:prepilin-type N-terminal cleavage/methylation domain-containing protein
MEKTVHRPGTPPICSRSHRAVGFTLIELSIVLVIIGLLVGAIVVGQEMIEGAAIRAQISQIDKYNTAVNTFRMRYNYLPGDMPTQVAGQFGFYNTGMTGVTGLGDGNGVIQDYNNIPGLIYLAGEPMVFWRHLSDANLIGGNYGASLGNGGMPAFAIPIGKFSSWLPPAKLGVGGFFTVYTDGTYNFYEIYPLQVLSSNNYGSSGEVGSMSPIEANAVDSKVDDGLPLSGRVKAMKNNGNPLGRPSTAGDGCTAPSGLAYDTGSSNRNLMNCILGVRFQ